MYFGFVFCLVLGQPPLRHHKSSPQGRPFVVSFGLILLFSLREETLIVPPVVSKRTLSTLLVALTLQGGRLPSLGEVLLRKADHLLSPLESPLCHPRQTFVFVSWGHASLFVFVLLLCLPEADFVFALSGRFRDYSSILRNHIQFIDRIGNSFVYDLASESNCSSFQLIAYSDLSPLCDPYY